VCSCLIDGEAIAFEDDGLSSKLQVVAAQVVALAA